jgi:uncharacterized membrane protein YphA (DoxX/SURF4 family)
MKKSRNPFGWLQNRWFLLVLRLFLAAIMLSAALPKFFDWAGIEFGNLNWELLPPPVSFEPFARMVYNYRLLPTSLVNLVAFTIPPVEAFGALCLITGLWLRSGSLMLGLLQLAFVVGMAQAWARGLDIQCGCFVGVDEKVGVWTLSRDTSLVLCYLLVFLGTFRDAKPEPGQEEEPMGEAPATA